VQRRAPVFTFLSRRHPLNRRSADSSPYARNARPFVLKIFHPPTQEGALEKSGALSCFPILLVLPADSFCESCQVSPMVRLFALLRRRRERIRVLHSHLHQQLDSNSVQAFARSSSAPLRRDIRVDRRRVAANMASSRTSASRSRSPFHWSGKIRRCAKRSCCRANLRVPLFSGSDGRIRIS